MRLYNYTNEMRLFSQNASPVCELAKRALSFYERLYAYAHVLAHHLFRVADVPPNDLRRRCIIRFLEALFFQQAREGKAHLFSVETVRKDFQEKKLFIEQKNLTEHVTSDIRVLDIVHAGCLASPTPELEDAWCTFITSLVRDGHKDSLIALAQEIKKQNIYHLWIPLCFSHAIGRCNLSTNAFDVLQVLVAELESGREELERIAVLSRELSARDLSGWQDPAQFERLMSEFELLVTNYSVPTFVTPLRDEIKSEIKNRLVYNARLALMHSFVNYVDNVIKTLKKSELYVHAEALLVQRVKLLTQRYASVFCSWCALVEPQDFGRVRDNYIKNCLNDLEVILQKALAGPDTVEQLQPVPDFSIAGAILGNPSPTVSWSIKYTIETAFSFVHQNLCAILGVLIPKILPPGGILPPVVRDLSCGALIGVVFTPDSIVAYFNMTLSAHSRACDVVYNRHDKSVLLTVRYMGSNCDNRWNNIQRLVIDSIKQGFDLCDTFLDPNTNMILFAYRVHPEDVSGINEILRTCDMLTAQSRYGVMDSLSQSKSAAPVRVINQQECSWRCIKFIIEHADSIDRHYVYYELLYNFLCVCEENFTEEQRQWAFPEIAALIQRHFMIQFSHQYYNAYEDMCELFKMLFCLIDSAHYLPVINSVQSVIGGCWNYLLKDEATYNYDKKIDLLVWILELVGLVLRVQYELYYAQMCEFIKQIIESPFFTDMQKTRYRKRVVEPLGRVKRIFLEHNNEHAVALLSSF
jgi:hypothetical protein